MSVFQVTRKDDVRQTMVAAQVISVTETENGTIISTSLGDLEVKDSYRSVRGYLKKALAGSAPVAEAE